LALRDALRNRERSCWACSKEAPENDQKFTMQIIHYRCRDARALAMNIVLVRSCEQRTRRLFKHHKLISCSAMCSLTSSKRCEAWYDQCTALGALHTPCRNSCSARDARWQPREVGSSPRSGEPMLATAIMIPLQRKAESIFLIQGGFTCCHPAKSLFANCVETRVGNAGDLT
jgi:hypothetical protein